jgi:hypothetical protein
MGADCGMQSGGRRAGRQQQQQWGRLPPEGPRVLTAFLESSGYWFRTDRMAMASATYSRTHAPLGGEGGRGWRGEGGGGVIPVEG